MYKFIQSALLSALLVCGIQTAAAAPLKIPGLMAIVDNYVIAPPEPPAEERVPGDGRSDSPEVDTSNVAAFMTIENDGRFPLTLMGASSPMAEHVAIRLSRDVDGLTVTQELTSISVPQGAALTMEPGSFHLLLSGLSSQLEAGDSIEISLEIESNDTVDSYSVTMPVIDGS